ncbi:MAG: cbb3-type cytochrome c oxidase subunit 3 [Bacteroidota bacterium]|nr:cbb3-type cytochrome c oxidase subunit 3 [Bacteroidota bacterium]MDP4194916.1 cbb3-type cytochrome c oxidase subunit 3 [Bacteroidota bacterium]
MFGVHLKDIKNLGIYPIISLIIFLFAFVLILIRTFTADKNYLKKMEELPLDLNNEDNNNFGRKVL